MTFDEDVDLIKQGLREWRFFHSLGPAMGLAPRPKKSTPRKLLECFVTYFTPFGLITMAVWPDAFSD